MLHVAWLICVCSSTNTSPGKMCAPKPSSTCHPNRTIPVRRFRCSSQVRDSLPSATHGCRSKDCIEQARSACGALQRLLGNSSWGYLMSGDSDHSLRRRSHSGPV